jgi:hypothetical protein
VTSSLHKERKQNGKQEEPLSKDEASSRETCYEVACGTIRERAVII